MLRGLYTSALGLMTASKNQEVTANNLANAASPGYKKDRLVTQSFADILLYRLHDPLEDKPARVGFLSKGVRVSEVVTDYSRGVLSARDNPYSLAVKGEGYFVINTPQGERYTKSGDFTVSSEGLLVTADGWPVAGQRGEIRVSGDFYINDNGVVFQNGEEADRLRVVEFNTPLAKEGASLFYGENPQDLLNPVISQNLIEESNVNSIEEMVRLLEVIRSYEANQKAVQTQDSTLDKAVNEIGRL